MIDFFISPAAAHGLSVGAEVDGFGPLVFLPVILGFAFFIYMHLKN